MANKFNNEMASTLLKLVGGKTNIVTASHCMTRVRLVLKKPVSKEDIAKIQELDFVQGAFVNAGQFQVIIGSDVAVFFKIFADVAKISKGDMSNIKEEAKKQGNWWQRSMSAFSEIFVPLIPVIVAGGLILAFRNMLELDWGSGSAVEIPFWKSLNDILWIPANAVFWYLPVHVTWSMFNRKKTVPSLGIVIGIMLVSPSILQNLYGVSDSIGSYLLNGDLIGTIEGGGETVVLSKGVYGLERIIEALNTLGHNVEEDATWEAVNTILEAEGVSGSYYIKNIFDAINANEAFYFGAWPYALSYVGQVIPALLVGAVSLWFYEFIEKHTHSSIKYVWPPFATIIVALFIGHGVLGPMGAAASYGITFVFEWAFTDTVAKYFFAPIFGFIYPLIVITGLHHTFNAVMLELTNIGANYIFPMLALSNIAQGAAVFAIVWMLREDPKTKEGGISAGTTSWLGVTEPTMFGYNLRFIFPFVAAMISSAIGSTLVVSFDITAAGIGMGGILGFLNIDNVLGSLPQWSAWLIFWAIMIIVIVSSFMLTISLSKKSKWFAKLSSLDWDEYVKSKVGKANSK